MLTYGYRMSSTEYTVKEAAQTWLRRCQLDSLERSTLRSYQQHVDLHILPRIGDCDLKTMAPADVHDFRDQLLADMSKAMAKKVLGSFKSMVSEAHARGHIQ
jgi:integrase